MWGASGGTSVVSGSAWSVLEVVVPTLGTLAAIWLRARLTRPQEPTKVVEATEPVATASARQAVEEFRDAVFEPIRDELERQNLLRQEAEAKQARAERVATQEMTKNERLVGQNAVAQREIEELRRQNAALTSELARLRIELEQLRQQLGEARSGDS